MSLTSHKTQIVLLNLYRNLLFPVICPIVHNNYKLSLLIYKIVQAIFLRRLYYKNRNAYGIWQHQPAINIDDLSQDTATSVIRGNCQYLEDRWRVSINPLLICYKNEYNRKIPGTLCQPANSTWRSARGSVNTLLPPITIRNTSLPSIIKQKGTIDFPNVENLEGQENALYGLYDLTKGLPIDNTNWLSDLSVYKTDFGEAQNRRETDIRDKFVKVRIRYSGEDLAVIDFLNTIYTVSYA